MSLPKIYFATPAEADVTSLLHALNRYIVNPIIMFMFAAALLYFLYGVFEFLSGADNDEKRTNGKSHMLWGVIGMAIMVGVFFFMTLIINTFGVTGVDVHGGTPANLQ